MLHEALSRILESVTNKELTVKSDYYGRTDSDINPTVIDGDGSLRCITNGLFIRRAKLTSGAISMFTSMREIMDSLNAIDCIGYGIEGNVLRIEPYKYFYNDEVIMSCKNIREINIAVDEKKYIQRFSGGFEKWSAEEDNGIDGFHGKRQYRTRLKMVDTELKKESKLIADGYAIEATRRRQESNETKDWRFDNDIFMICVRRNNNSFVVDTGVTNTDGSVVDESTIYNGAISPARNAMRWYSMIMQGLNDDDKLIFAGAEGYSNAKMLVQNPTFESTAIAENQDLSMSSFSNENISAPIFSPMKVTFEYPFRTNDFKAVKRNPAGLVEYDGKYGWISRIEFDKTIGMAKFELIPKR